MGRRKTIGDDELLAVAREVFVDEGIGASSRTIAARAGVSESVLFQRFRTKADLFFAAMVPPAPGAATFAGNAGEADPTLAEVALRTLSYLRSTIPIVIPLIAHPEFSYERFVDEHPEMPIARLIEDLQQWCRRGSLGVADDVRELVPLALVAMAGGLALLERIGVHSGSFDDDLVRRLAVLLEHGLAD